MRESKQEAEFSPDGVDLRNWYIREIALPYDPDCRANLGVSLIEAQRRGYNTGYPCFLSTSCIGSTKH